MAKDFKASQIRTTQIIASSSLSTRPSLMILSASSAGVDFNGSVTLPSTVGRDVFIFVSGSTNSFGTSFRGVTLFGGDIVVSGSLYNATGGSYGNVAGSNTQVQFNDAGAFGASLGFIYDKNSHAVSVGNLYVTGTSLNVSGSLTVAQNLIVNGTTTTVNTTNLVVKDPLIYFGSGTTSTNQNGGIALASGSNTTGQALVWGRVASDTWGAGKQDVTAGTTTDLTSMTLVPVRSSKLELGGSSAFVSSSDSSRLELAASTQVLILSGGSSTSLNPKNFSDVNFFVSGALSSKGSATRGVAAFGGDVVASGTLYADTSVKTPIVNSDGYTTFQVGGTDVAYMQTTGLGFAFNPVVGKSVSFGGNKSAIEAPDLTIKKLYSTDTPNLSSDVTDTFLYISGAIGSKDSATKGVTVLGGDVVISGTLHGGSPLKIGSSVALSGSLRLKTQDSAPDVGTNESVIYVLDSGGTKKLYWKNSDGTQQQVGTGGGSSSGTFNEVNSGGTISLVTTASVSLAGGKGFIYGVDQVGADTFFFVSGSLSSRGGSSGEVAVFGGHTVFSGALFGGVNPDLGRTLLRQEASQIAFSKEEGLAAGSVTGTDIFMFVSGAIGSRGTSIRGTSVFGGDLYVSGVVYGVSGISGSLTRLADGTPYLVAGSNITLATGSNGAVTISSTGGGTPGGSDTQVQFNDGGSTFGGDSGLTYIKGTDTLNVVNVSMIATNDQVFQLKDNSAGALNIGAGSDNKWTFNTGNGQERLGFWDGVRASFGDINDPDLNIQHDGTNSLITNKTGRLILSGANGLEVTGSTKFVQGLSGSLTKLTDGTSYLIAGENVTITTGTNGAVTIASTGGGIGGDSFFSSTTNGSIFTSGSAAFRGLESSIDSPADKGADVFFYVSGSSGAKGIATPAIAAFGGDVVISGTLHGGVQFGSSTGLTIQASKVQVTANTLNIGQSGGNDVSFFVSGSSGSKDGASPGTALIGGDLVVSGSTYIASGSSVFPATDLGSNLGSPSNRFGNIYTGDLHLRNERGDWTIVEEEDYLCVVNNKTGKKFKMALIPLEE